MNTNTTLNFGQTQNLTCNNANESQNLTRNCFLPGLNHDQCQNLLESTFDLFIQVVLLAPFLYGMILLRFVYQKTVDLSKICWSKIKNLLSNTVCDSTKKVK